MARHADEGPTLVQLIERLRHGGPNARRAAAGALGGRGPAAVAAVPELVAALSDADATLSRLAAAALGDIGPAAAVAVPALRAALAGGAPELRRRIVLALAAVGTPEALDALRRAAADPDEAVRRFAHLALSAVPAA